MLFPVRNSAPDRVAIALIPKYDVAYQPIKRTFAVKEVVTENDMIDNEYGLEVGRKRSWKGEGN